MFFDAKASGNIDGCQYVRYFGCMARTTLTLVTPEVAPEVATDAVGDSCAASSHTVMPADRAACLADIFKALADPTRVRLLAHIAASPDGTACACHLPDALGVSQPTLSHHLKKLAEAGLVIREQRGRWAHYTAVAATLDVARSFIGEATDGVRCC